MKKFILAILAIAAIAFAEPYHIDIQFKGFDRLEAIDSTDWIIDTLDNRCLLREEIKSHRDTIWAGTKKIVVQPNRYVNEHPMDYYDLVTCKADDMVGKERYKLVVQHFVRFRCPDNPKYRIYEQHIAEMVVRECALPYKVDWLVKFIPGLHLPSRLIEPHEKSWYEKL